MEAEKEKKKEKLSDLFDEFLRCLAATKVNSLSRLG